MTVGTEWRKLCRQSLGVIAKAALPTLFLKDWDVWKEHLCLSLALPHVISVYRTQTGGSGEVDALAGHPATGGDGAVSTTFLPHPG